MFLPIQIKHLASMVVILLLSIILAACGGGGSVSDSGLNEDPGPEIIKSISGTAQKGAFKKGSSVSAFQLDALAARNGEVVSSTVSDDSGNFSVTPTWSGWTEISVTGRYFDENSVNTDATGLTLSATELTLNSLVSEGDEDALFNVNLFTHFIAARIRYLLTTNDPNITIEQARNQAQDDLKQQFELLSDNAEKLDIFDGVGVLKNDNAILLLFSGGFMSNNGNATSLLALTDDFANNGQIDDGGLVFFQEIANYAGITENLVKLSDNLKQTGVQDPPLIDDLPVRPGWVNQAPIVTITPKSKTIVKGASITLFATKSLDPDGESLTYSWGGDGTDKCGDLDRCVLNGLNVGSHSITVSARDERLSSASDSALVSVVPVDNPNKLPTAILNPASQTVKKGIPAVFDASGSFDPDDENLSYAWSGPGTESCEDNKMCSINGLDVGDYYITVSTSDINGGVDSALASLTISHPNIPPVAIAGNDQTITANQDVELSGAGTDSDGFIANYEWKQGVLSIGSSQKIIISNLSVGLHKYILTVTDNDGATATDTVSIRVKETTNSPPVANAGNDQTIPEGEAVLLSGSGSDADGTISSYQWFEAGNLLGQGTNIAAPGLSVGSHIVTLVVTDNLGATGSDVVRVTVTGTSNIPPLANAGNDQTKAEGEAVLLSGSGSDVDGTISSYQWFEGGNLLGQGANITVSGLSVGSHIVTLVITDNLGATGSDVVRVTVTGTSNISPVANAGNDQTIAEGEAVLLSGSGSDADGTISSYQWFKGGNLLGQGTNITIPDLSVGSHIITLLVTDNLGGEGNDTVIVSVTTVNVSVDVSNSGCIVRLGGRNFKFDLTLQGGKTGSGTIILQEYDGAGCTGSKIGNEFSLPSTYTITNIQTNDSITTADMTVSNLAGTEVRQVTIEDGKVVY